MSRQTKWEFLPWNNGCLTVIVKGALDKTDFGTINKTGDLCLSTNNGLGVQISAEDLRALADIMEKQKENWIK